MLVTMWTLFVWWREACIGTPYRVRLGKTWVLVSEEERRKEDAYHPAFEGK